MPYPIDHCYFCGRLYTQEPGENCIGGYHRSEFERFVQIRSLFAKHQENPAQASSTRGTPTAETEGQESSGELHCCYVYEDGHHCEFAPAWQITDGPSPDDYTHACTDHVGTLLQDRLSIVTPLDATAAASYPIAGCA